jgi:hypothetical protein
MDNSLHIIKNVNTSNKINLPFVVKCPHCNEYILISELNCRIFRHGVMKSTNEQINPHSPKNICDELYNTNKIYGCGKPFCINEKLYVEKCDYI